MFWLDTETVKYITWLISEHHASFSCRVAATSVIDVPLPLLVSTMILKSSPL